MTISENEAVNALSAQATALFQEVTITKNGVAQQIADAVALSENAALIPMVTMATNLIATQTLIVNCMTSLNKTTS